MKSLTKRNSEWPKGIRPKKQIGLLKHHCFDYNQLPIY